MSQLNRTNSGGDNVQKLLDITKSASQGNAADPQQLLRGIGGGTPPAQITSRNVSWKLDGQYDIISQTSWMVGECNRNGFPTWWAAKAGTFTLPLGKHPGRGWFLIQKSVLYQMSQNGTYDNLHALVLTCGNDQVTLTNLVIVPHPVCITPGLGPQGRGDLTSTYLVEVADPRYLAQNHYFANLTNSQFNVIAPDAGWVAATGNTTFDTLPVTAFYQSSLNAGEIYTWQDVLDSLWEDVNISEFGLSPQLPFEPTLVPNNLKFIDIPAWEAYNQVLERLSCAFAWWPDGSVRIVRKGDTDPNFALAVTKYDVLPWAPYDEEPPETVRSKVPSQVTVVFHTLYEQFGQEKTLQPDATQWSTQSPTYAITLPAPDDIGTTEPGSTKIIYDDLVAILELDGETAENIAELTVRAQARANSYYRQVTGTRFRRVYGGFVNDPGLLPNSQITAVQWKQQGATGQGSWTGAMTDVLYTPYMLLVDDTTGDPREDFPEAKENFRVPDLARASYPIYPRQTYQVKIDSSNPIIASYYLAELLAYDVTTDAFFGSGSCWAKPLNGFALVQGQNYTATLIGQAYSKPLLTVGDDDQPACPSYQTYETDMRCESDGTGHMVNNVYRTYVTYAIINGCTFPSEGEEFLYSTQGCCDCGSVSGTCCRCTVFTLTLSGLSPGCDGNDTYTLAYSGSPCVWSGVGASTGSQAVLTMPINSCVGATASLVVTTAGGCQATYSGIVTSETSITLTLNFTGSGTGWPMTVTLTCAGGTLCCQCTVYNFMLAGLSTGCDGNGSYSMAFSGSNCIWSGSGGSGTGGSATLTFPPNTCIGSTATLTITTAGGCQASYSGVVSNALSFVVNLDSIFSGTGWPASITVTCGDSTGTGTISGGSGACTYTVTASLLWPFAPPADLDLYVKNVTTGDICWFGMPTAGALALNHDAFPDCDPTPVPPEIITGSYSSVNAFRVWYSQWSHCAPKVSPGTIETMFKVHNTSASLNVLVTTVAGTVIVGPGATTTVLTDAFAYAGYDTGAQQNFPNGSPVLIQCAGTGTGTGPTGTGPTGTGPTGTGPTGTGPISGGIVTGCCPGVGIPMFIRLTFSGSLVSLNQPGGIILTYGGGNQWFGASPGCGGTVNLIFSCTIASLWNLSGNGSAAFGGNASSVFCSPLLITGAGSVGGGLCMGGYSWTISS